MKLGWTPNGGALLSFELFGVSAHTHFFSSKCVYHNNCWSLCIHQVLLVLTIAFHYLCTGPLQGNKKEMHDFFLIPIASKGSGKTGTEVTAADGKAIGRRQSRALKTEELTLSVMAKEKTQVETLRSEMKEGECVKQLQTQTMIAAAHAQGVAMAKKNCLFAHQQAVAMAEKKYMFLEKRLAAVVEANMDQQVQTLTDALNTAEAAMMALYDKDPLVDFKAESLPTLAEFRETAKKNMSKDMDVCEDECEPAGDLRVGSPVSSGH
jgi:hypothetical protein